MFIDFEGIDGSGKTTLSNLLAERLRRMGHRVTHAREGGELKATIARRLRELTRDPSLLEMCARTEFLLNVARDAQQLEEVIRPALARGEVVIADRYLYSQLAHSHAGRGLPREALDPVLELAAQGVWPDLVILVDVDPELARLRKRVLRLGLDELEPGSRKGLVGAWLAVRVREAFLQMASKDRQRWLVVENDHQPLSALADRIVEAVRARLEGREPEVQRINAGSTQRPAVCLQNLEATFFTAVDELELREPDLALYLLTGVPGARAHQRRLRFVDQKPGAVARTLLGLGDPESEQLRELLAKAAPREVLASLGADPSLRAMALREALFEVAPRQAVIGLKGMDSDRAWALRERAVRQGDVEGVLFGLSGVDSDRSWALRTMALERRLWTALARSLTGVAGERADALRAELVSRDRLAVLRSTTGLETPFARTLRESLYEMAPKVVLRSLTGIDAPWAWRMRAEQAPRTKEALDSVDGMSVPQAWALRERFWYLWPSTAISSLRELALTARGQALIEQVLSHNPGRVAVLRNAYLALARVGAMPETNADGGPGPRAGAGPAAEAAAS